MAAATKRRSPRRQSPAARPNVAANGIRLVPEPVQPIAPEFKVNRGGAYLDTEVSTDFGTFIPARAADGSSNVGVTLNASIAVSRAPDRVSEVGATYLSVKIARMRSDGGKWVVSEEKHHALEDIRATDIPVLARAFAELCAQMVEDGTLALVAAAEHGGRE